MPKLRDDLAGLNTHVRNPNTKNINLLPVGRIDPSRVSCRFTLDDASKTFVVPDAGELSIRDVEAGVQDIIALDPASERQEIIGFGGTIMDSDVANLQRLEKDERAAAVRALADPRDGLGLSLMRIPFGSTDWNRDWDFYTYCDTPDAKDDLELSCFSIEKDRERGCIEMIRTFLEVNPDIRLLASVWGVPPWMTTNRRIMHGCFDSRYTDVYAEYLARSVAAYRDEGIPIHYITVQNEPGTGGDRNTPAAMWTWQQCREVTRALHGRLKDRGLDVAIWIMDHNFDMTQVYAKPLLDDPETRPLVGGVAYHDYRGHPSEMELLLRQHPDIPAVLTERNRGGLKSVMRMLKCIAHGASGHISWTTVVDDRGGPHQYDGGSDRRDPTPDLSRAGHIMVVSPGEHAEAVRPITYHYYAQLTRFVSRGDRLIASSDVTHADVTHVAFRTSDGAYVVVMGNTGDRGRDLAVQLEGQAYPFHCPAKSMMSLRIQ